jgi:hypothetical protein
MAMMVAVVTKRTGVTLTLGSKSHHLVEVRPAGDWLDRSWVEDVIVLDLETGDATSAAVEHLRLTDAGKPIVVIAADGAPWDRLTSQYPDLFVVPLPITASTLLDTVDRARAASRTVSVTPPARGIDVAERPITDAPEPVVVPVRTEQPAPSHPEPHQVAGKRRLREEPVTGSRPAPPAPPLRPQVTPSVPLADPEGPDASLGPVAPRGLALFPQMNMVRALLLEVGLLPRVADTAAVVLSRAIEAAAADAAAVLVPDDGVWRVEAGSSLRPLEERVQISASHWLVAEIAIGGRGLLIQNTDVARNQLAGAPLASWANLLAVPVAGEVFLILAREHSEFNREELTLVAGAVAGLDAAMNDAIDVRRLARKMIDYLDLVE